MQQAGAASGSPILSNLVFPSDLFLRVRPPRTSWLPLVGDAHSSPTGATATSSSFALFESTCAERPMFKTRLYVQPRRRCTRYLALSQAWRAHGSAPPQAPFWPPLLDAKRLTAFVLSSTVWYSVATWLWLAAPPWRRASRLWSGRSAHSPRAYRRSKERQLLRKWCRTQAAASSRSSLHRAR